MSASTIIISQIVDYFKAKKNKKEKHLRARAFGTHDELNAKQPFNGYMHIKMVKQRQLLLLDCFY